MLNNPKGVITQSTEACKSAPNHEECFNGVMALLNPHFITY